MVGTCKEPHFRCGFLISTHREFRDASLPFCAIHIKAGKHGCQIKYEFLYSVLVSFRVIICRHTDWDCMCSADCVSKTSVHNDREVNICYVLKESAWQILAMLLLYCCMLSGHMGQGEYLHQTHKSI